MKIFISWSGDASRHMAHRLSGWLQSVIQSVDPFVSEEIDKGAKWFTEIMSHLKDCRFGIVCLTPDNLDAPWLHFEAGAIANAVQKANVSPLLIGIEPSDVGLPLSQFQLTRAERNDVLRLVKSVNKAGESPLSDSVLMKSFDSFWKDFETGLSEALELLRKPAPEKTRRAPEAVLAELLDLARGNQRALDEIDTRLGSLVLLPAPSVPSGDAVYTGSLSGLAATLQELQRKDAIREAMPKLPGLDAARKILTQKPKPDE